MLCDTVYILESEKGTDEYWQNRNGDMCREQTYRRHGAAGKKIGMESGETITDIYTLLCMEIDK